MRTVFAIASLLASSSAFAGAGIGTTFQLGPDFGPAGIGGFTYLPTLDIYPGPVVLQIHALDTLAWLIDDTDQIFLGANVYVPVYRTNALPGTFGVVEPGGSLDIYAFDGEFALVLGGQARIGIEGGEGMKLGAYIVPGVGVAAGDIDEGAVWSGAFQLSMWFGGGT